MCACMRVWRWSACPPPPPPRQHTHTHTMSIDGTRTIPACRALALPHPHPHPHPHHTRNHTHTLTLTVFPGAAAVLKQKICHLRDPGGRDRECCDSCPIHVHACVASNSLGQCGHRATKFGRCEHPTTNSNCRVCGRHNIFRARMAPGTDARRQIHRPASWKKRTYFNEQVHHPYPQCSVSSHRC